MKRLVVAVLGVLVAAPAWAGGHFEPHSMVAPSVNGLTHVWRPSEAISPPDLALGPLVKPVWKD